MLTDGKKWRLGRFRSDVSLKYLYTGLKTEKMGWPKEVDGKMFVSTDTEMQAKDFVDIYRTKFQVVFLLRDSKQYTGLVHCQSRQKEMLAFHFNMSLTAINVARAFASQDKRNLSAANIKTLIHNAMIIRRFSMLSGKSPNKLLNTNDFKKLLYYGIANAAQLFKN